VERAKLPNVPVQDIAMLRVRLPDVRSKGEFLAFAKAIMAAASSSTSPLGWKQTGLIVTDLLLRPLSAGEPTTFLVAEYEKTLNRTPRAPQPLQSWSGEVWPL
jgi:hypothetical protein